MCFIYEITFSLIVVKLKYPNETVVSFRVVRPSSGLNLSSPQAYSALFLLTVETELVH